MGRDEVMAQALGERAAALPDRLERVRLADVIGVCRRSRSISAAGRELFAVSRTASASPTMPTVWADTSPASD